MKKLIVLMITISLLAIFVLSYSLYQDLKELRKEIIKMEETEEDRIKEMLESKEENKQNYQIKVI
jgi:hypothetical protein